MITNVHGPVQALDSRYRLSTEDHPITVRPYMITERDLAAIGHAQCVYCSKSLVGAPKVPWWLVSGWASCDKHLATVIEAAAAFNHRHLIWSDSYTPEPLAATTEP